MNYIISREKIERFVFQNDFVGLHSHSQSNHINQLGPQLNHTTTAPSTPNLYSSSTNLLATPCSTSNVRELQSILREIRFITNRLKVKDEEDEVVADWKFAAMVIDRYQFHHCSTEI